MSPLISTAHYSLPTGVRLHVYQAGPAEGPLLLFLHGFPEYGGAWHHQLAFFAEQGYRVLAPDQRGYHLSSKPASIRDYSLDKLVADILALLAAAGGNQRVHLVGHDWGGAVAWHLASHHPERLRSVTFINMPHPEALKATFKRTVRQWLRSWYIGFFQLPGLPEQTLRFHKGRFLANLLRQSARPGAFSEEELANYRRAWLQPGAARGMLNWYRAAVRYRRYPPTGRVGAPALLLWGQQDTALDFATVAPSLAWCDNGQLHVFPDNTHWVYHEQPTAVNQRILDFIREQ